MGKEGVKNIDFEAPTVVASKLITLKFFASLSSPNFCSMKFWQRCTVSNLQ
jgi:hypothetical protein